MRRSTLLNLAASAYVDQGDIGRLRDLVKAIVRSFLIVRHMSVTLFRYSQILGRRAPAAGHVLKQLNHLLTGADLAWQAEVGPGLVLHHPTGVVWGPGVRLGSHCRLQQGVTIGGRGGSRDDGSPVIGDRVILGAGSRVLGPIELGSDSVVGANAVVIKDVPTHSIAVGVPAVIRSRRSTDD